MFDTSDSVYDLYSSNPHRSGMPRSKKDVWVTNNVINRQTLWARFFFQLHWYKSGLTSWWTEFGLTFVKLHTKHCISVRLENLKECENNVLIGFSHTKSLSFMLALHQDNSIDFSVITHYFLLISVSQNKYMKYYCCYYYNPRTLYISDYLNVTLNLCSWRTSSIVKNNQICPLDDIRVAITVFHQQVLPPEASNCCKLFLSLVGLFPINEMLLWLSSQLYWIQICACEVS